jgi:hypothetical protein
MSVERLESPISGGFELLDLKGNRVSFHRTQTGALRKRLELIEETNGGENE